MRAAGLFAFAAHLGLHILGVQGVITCHADHSLTNSFSTDLLKLQKALDGPVADLCNKGLALKVDKDKVLAYIDGNAVFKIERSETAQDAEECKTAFSAIISRCISDQLVRGGLFRAVGGRVLYEISYVDAGNDDFVDLIQHNEVLEARAKKPAKKATKNPTKKPTKKPAKKPTKKPEQKPTKPSSKPSGKPTRNPPVKPSKTTASAKPTPTKTCKKLYAEAVAASKNAALTEKREESLTKREGFSGSRVHVEKRSSPKDGKACKVVLNALNYPDKKEMVIPLRNYTLNFTFH